MFDWTGNFFHLTGRIEKIHFVVTVSYFVWNTACPGLDLVKAKILLIVSGFAHVNMLISWKAARPAFVKSGHEHNEATIHNLANLVIAVLPCLDNLVLEEMLLKAMDSLLRPIVPACIDPFLSLAILPHAEDLANCGFREVVWVADMNPIPCSV